MKLDELEENNRKRLAEATPQEFQLVDAVSQLVDAVVDPQEFQLVDAVSQLVDAEFQLVDAVSLKQLQVLGAQ